ncbi:methylglutaconyl-CoA hydratase [Neorhodopirellula lusitana]|uniref:Methylglutaconyl-CoA hydratase n=1 Tax=Neorhodopirellula lusitana TaxID=445327 RepID=A0ABY1QDQ0_9BACT|nr:enoyl-CoA hydratase/isomerase family protein [Neorhodopirellula lusitana]SMP68445.1 methylglutaconyl-CoA hydratase [Neorhodopirellula lusitana]
MQHVEVKVHESVATLLIDRPEKHGALSPGLLTDLRQAISDVHQEKRVRAVVLTAHGKSFCSGVDMSVLKAIGDLPDSERLQQWLTYWRELAETCEDMLRFPKPIVAAVDGHAIGAGFAIALACDMIVASDRAVFSAQAVRHGLVGGITAALLAFRTQASLAARMSLTGTEMLADEAESVGLLCRPPVASEQVWIAATEVAKQASVGSPQAIQATKRLINETIGETLMTQISAAAADSATACTTESATKGIDAFASKNTPSW